VEYRGPPREVAARLAEGRRPVEVALGHASFLATTTGASHAERLDLTVRGAELGAGIALDVDARAVHWVRRERPRFRPGDETQLYLWQAQLTAPAGRALTLAAGRVLPWTIPGATVFDGGSAALRLGPAEVGLFGGAVPEPDTLSPTAERATGGAFWSVARARAGGALLRHEGRLAVVRSPELGTRVETTLAGRAYLRAVDLSVEAQLGAGGEVRAPGLLDSARVDLAARPVRGVSFGASYRHLALEWPQPFEPPAFPGRSRAADAWAAWDLAPSLRIGVSGGLSRDVESGLDRQWAGPELAFPRLLGSRGGVTLGYLEERGWLEGRSAYVQVVARPWDRLRLLARGSWSHDASLGTDRDDLGLFAAASADLGRGFGMRVSFLGRTPASGGGALALASTVGAAVFGTY
jgi:hypothetical protein